MKSLWSLTLLVTLAATPHPIHAQILYGSITGNVTDHSGAALPGAKIDALNVATGIARQTLTDDRGVYLINNRASARYDLR